MSLGSAGIPSSLGERVGLRYAGERDRVVSLPQQRAGGLHSRASSVSGSGMAGAGVVPMPRTTSGKGRERGEDGGEQHTAQVHVPGTSAPRKRYSSSFGHRYGSPLSGSVGSGGGVGEDGMGKEREKDKDKQQQHPHPYAHPHSPHPHPHSPLSPHYSPSSSQMYMKAGNADDDEISVFVQDIDARKMLRGASRETSLERAVAEVMPRRSSSSSLGYEHGGQRRQPLFERSGEGGGGVMDLNAERNADGDREGNGVTTSGLMLTSEREVDERLRRMNEVFWGSLEGLGGATRSASASTSGNGGARAEGGLDPEIRFRSLRSGATQPTQGIAIPIPQAFRRQGEGSVEEVVGRMEEEGEGEAEAEEWGRGRGMSGGGGRSGERYYMF